MKKSKQHSKQSACPKLGAGQILAEWKGESGCRNGKKGRHSLPWISININGVVDKVIKMTPRSLLGITQKEMTPGLQICILSV